MYTNEVSYDVLYNNEYKTSFKTPSFRNVIF